MAAKKMTIVPSEITDGSWFLSMQMQGIGYAACVFVSHDANEAFVVHQPTSGSLIGHQRWWATPLEVDVHPLADLDDQVRLIQSVVEATAHQIRNEA